MENLAGGTAAAVSWPPFAAPVASHEGAQLHDVLVAVHWHVVLVFAVCAAVFLYSLRRFRAGAHSPPRRRGVRPVVPLAAVSMVVAGEALILFGSALPAWRARWTPLSPQLNTLEVRVVGEQFAWNVHYPGPDRIFGATRLSLVSASNPLGIDRNDGAAQDDIGLLNVLTVPDDRTIVLHLSSRDVIHNFTLVDMRVKQDMTPGRITRTWFTPSRTGTWDIVCSQLCGLGHYRMKGALKVLPVTEWDEWQAAEVARIVEARGPSR